MPLFGRRDAAPQPTQPIPTRSSTLTESEVVRVLQRVQVEIKTQGQKGSVVIDLPSDVQFQDVKFVVDTALRSGERAILHWRGGVRRVDESATSFEVWWNINPVFYPEVLKSFEPKPDPPAEPDGSEVQVPSTSKPPSSPPEAF